MIYRNLLAFLWLLPVSNICAAEEEVLLFLSDDRIDLLASDGNESGAEDLIRRYYGLLAAHTGTARSASNATGQSHGRL